MKYNMRHVCVYIIIIIPPHAIYPTSMKIRHISTYLSIILDGRDPCTRAHHTHTIFGIRAACKPLT